MSSTTNIRNLLTPMLTIASMSKEEDAVCQELLKEVSTQVNKNVQKIVNELKIIDDTQFTIEEFKKYLSKQDSFGDAVYNLSPLKVKLAQYNWCKDCDKNCRCEKLYDQNELHGFTVACSDYEGR